MELNEETIKRIENIIDTSSCYVSLEDEVLKLFCLFSRCNTQKHNGQEFLTRDYVLEKIFRLLDKMPLVLSSDAIKLFVRMKISKEDR